MAAFTIAGLGSAPPLPNALRARATGASAARCQRAIAPRASSASTPSRAGLSAAALARGAAAGKTRPVKRGDLAVTSATFWGAKDPKYQNSTVFNVSTEKLPGGDSLTNEGILGFVVAGALAIWFGGTLFKTLAVMFGFIFTTAKYFMMGIALVLIGVAAS